MCSDANELYRSELEIVQFEFELESLRTYKEMRVANDNSVPVFAINFLFYLTLNFTIKLTKISSTLIYLISL